MKYFVIAAVCAIATSAQGQVSFSNASAISIPTSGQAAPYPSTIGVPFGGSAAIITNVVVTLKGVTHPRVSDLDIVLVSPGGLTCELISDAGGDNAVANVDLTFSRTGRLLRGGEAIGTGTYSPVNIGNTLENFPAPGPGLVTNTDLAIYDGKDSPGTWSLFVVDDSAGPASVVGSIAGGWTIRFNDPVSELAQSTSQFSYQGVLKRDGAPYQGSADLRFTLWNSPTDATPGAQFGAGVTLPGVAVSGGVFSVLLDFGPRAFGEFQRFLQVEARTPADGGNFVTVLPRTPLTGVPFSGVAPLAKSANQLDAPDGSPLGVITVDNFGGVDMNGAFDLAGTLTIAGPLTTNGGIVLPATTRTRIVAATSWRPVSSSMEYTVGSGDRMTGSTAGTPVAFYLPLELPQDAILTGVTIFYQDSSTDQNISFALRRVLNNGNASTNVSIFATAGTPSIASISSPALSDPVNAASYAHQLLASWTVPANPVQIKVGSVVVTYTVTSPLP